MKEAIYIDGELMDLAAGKVNVQLIYQSPILLDFQQIVSNRTTQVSLPATPHNLKAVGYTGTQAVSDFAYRFHTVIYKRDGLQLLKGNATLLSISKGSITMCFTWGNVTAMKSLFDTKLRDLENTPYCSYPPLGQGDSLFCSGLNYGGNRWGVACNASDILTAIETKCGVTGLQALRFQLGDGADGYEFSLSLPTRNGNLTTRYMQGIKFGNIGAKTVSSGALVAYTLMTKGANSTDPHNYMDGDGYIDVQNAEKVRIHLKGQFTMVKHVTTDVEHEMQLVGYDNNTETYTLIDTLCTASVSGSGSTKTIEYNFDVDATYDVGSYTHLVIVLFHDVLDYQPESVTTTTLPNRYIVPNPHLDDEVIYDNGIASCYPVFYNLPDITCGEFIKNLLWLRGEFAYSKDGTTFQFISFNQIETNKANALDWTQKMKGVVQEYKTTLDDTAQQNLFRYAEGDWYDNTQYQGVLPTDDETIDKEREYCKSDFALAPEQKYPVWVVNDNNEWDFQGDGLPFVMMLAREYNNIIYRAGYWDVQRFQNLLDTYYQQYAKIILRPVQIKANVILTTADLYALDLTVPVYLKQTGHYYLIRKLSIKGASEAEVELIKI